MTLAPELRRRISEALDRPGGLESDAELLRLLSNNPEAQAYADDLLRLESHMRDWTLPSERDDDAWEAFAKGIEARLDDALPIIADPTQPVDTDGGPDVLRPRLSRPPMASVPPPAAAPNDDYKKRFSIDNLSELDSTEELHIQSVPPPSPKASLRPIGAPVERVPFDASMPALPSSPPPLVLANAAPKKKAASRAWMGYTALAASAVIAFAASVSIFDERSEQVRNAEEVAAAPMQVAASAVEEAERRVAQETARHAQDLVEAQRAAQRREEEMSASASASAAVAQASPVRAAAPQPVTIEATPPPAPTVAYGGAPSPEAPALAAVEPRDAYAAQAERSRQAAEPAVGQRAAPARTSVARFAFDDAPVDRAGNAGSADLLLNGATTSTRAASGAGAPAQAAPRAQQAQQPASPTPQAQQSQPSQTAVRDGFESARSRVVACARNTGVDAVQVSIEVAGATGRVNNASVSGALAGQPAGVCIVGVLRSITMPPFASQSATFRTVYVLPSQQPQTNRAVRPSSAPSASDRPEVDLDL